MTEETLNQLFLDYESKKSNTYLQKTYKISYKKLIKLVKEKGIYKPHNSLTYSQEILDYITTNYLIKENKEIAKELGINENWIREAAKKLNLSKKGSGWKYTPELDSINYESKEFFYFLGWMASDGNISKDFRNVKLAITDQEIVQKFQTFFQAGVIYKKNYNQKKDLFIYCICSIKLAQYLNTLGITPAKTYSLELTESIWKSPYVSHFLRGFFEGDGHIRNTPTARGGKRYEAGFTSASPLLVNQLQSFLKTQGIEVKCSQKQKTFRLRISGKENLKRFTDFIYNDCDNWVLERKYQIVGWLFSDE